MPNMQKEKTPMPLLSVEKRRTTFEEVALGYSVEDAINEAKRCLNCKNSPCRSGCPVGIDIPAFISRVAEGDFEGAYEIIERDNCLSAVSGRVCPQERQCEGKCVRGIKGESVGIGRLERFVSDYMRAKKSVQRVKSNGKRIAVIGTGPAGLSCAGELLNMGFEVTLFEAFHKAGGVLVYGIPEFRLPKAIVAEAVDALVERGARLETNAVIGRTLTVDELFEEGYSAVFIGSGAGLPMFMGIEGEALIGVLSANEYLTRINLMKAYLDGYDTPVVKSRRVAVIGAGNVAMDAARCAVRLGAEEVSIVYRRGEEEIPARAEEVEHAKEEGVIFRLLTSPEKILGDEQGKVRAMLCYRTELGDPDASGRRRPVRIEGSEFELEVDTVIMALGTTPNPLLKDTTPGLDTNSRGCLVTSDGITTTREGVFAGGDAVTGAATVILAMGAGKEGARKIKEYINGVSFG
ncbi:MAG: NADPH-dependent glutamate synthase [Clostridia bacterium]|nr:NADPH-dependent glutamate synthase [Clostridia bacterium]